MKPEEKQEYLEEYQKAKKKGIPFFPDAVFKDFVVGAGVLVILIGLAWFIGAPLEERANPADTNYTPRPEWYFLFVFQLLKYFPGRYEVIGVVVIPVLAALVLVALPFIDRTPLRHFKNRKAIAWGTAIAGAFVVFLTAQSILEAAPPSEGGEDGAGDPVAALYADNCAGCHGSTIAVEPGTDLHQVIATGGHEGMPAWGSDLSADEIDNLVGFILSPGGGTVFNQQCAECHDASTLAASDPFDLRSALTGGASFEPHADLGLPNWGTTLDPGAQAALLNFLVAPDGQRLWGVYCAECHGGSVKFEGSPRTLRTLIQEGGEHLEMPPWRDLLPPNDLIQLSWYVFDPASSPEGAALFVEHCTGCHGARLPERPEGGEDVAQVYEIIANGMAHQTMPVWGEALTSEQIESLVTYIIESQEGVAGSAGLTLYAQMCASCHGQFGEGGPHPTRAGDIIPPISTAEYLTTRDDWTLAAIISQGQPDSGMSPFGEAYGGPLSEVQVSAIVSLLRSWQANPPVEVGVGETTPGEPTPEAPTQTVSGSGAEVFRVFCAKCHGGGAEGGIGPSLIADEFQDGNTDEDIFNTIHDGHEATPMFPWGDVLSRQQITDLVSTIRQAGGRAPSAPVAFVTEVVPILEANCAGCHGAAGGWDAATYDSIINSGDSGPAVIPGDPDGSVLVQRLLGEGGLMPPGGAISQADIDTISRWIAEGALEQPEGGGEAGEGGEEPTAGAAPTWDADVGPLFAQQCASCHGALGGWSAADKNSAINSGDNGPAVIPGDPDGSLLMARLRGEGGLMPPGGSLADAQLQMVADWIAGGAP